MWSRIPTSIALVLLAVSLPNLEGQAIRIMPLGDSLTSGVNGTDSTGNGGYRLQLEKRLLAAGIPFDFVGQRAIVQGDGGGALTDSDHEGWGGHNINGDPPGAPDFSLRFRIASTLPVLNSQPDLVLVMAGSNNVIWTTEPLGHEPQEQQLSTDLNALYNEIWNQAPNTHIIGATIPPANPNSVTPRAPLSKVIAFNQIISDTITGRMIAGSQISFCDIFASIDAPTTDITIYTPSPDFLTGAPKIDGVHPSSSGYDKIGNQWFASIEEYFWQYLPLYRNSTKEANGWRLSPTFGHFYDNQAFGSAWRYHENLGWFWAEPTKSPEHQWLWVTGFGWCYANPSYWPNIFRDETAEWYYIDPAAVRSAYRYTTGRWGIIPSS